LVKFLVSQTASDSLAARQGLKSLCRSFIGTAKLESTLDSIKTLQVNFIMNYLSRDKQVPVERFKIITVAPDTIKPLGNWPALRAYFTAAGEN
jgi:hypothetical protein